MIREAVANLLDGKLLTREQAAGAMADIMAGEATNAQIGAFIAALRLTGETPEVVAGCAETMRANATPIRCDDPAAVDVVGTGGDGAHTFNVSTTAAFVVAGAGATVAKHGSYGVSSRCGSADVLSALGIDVRYPPETAARCLNEIGIAFLFAPALHPAMKHVAGPRRELGVRSIFNVLGPLCNPAGVRRAVIGVYAESLRPLVAESCRQLGMERVFVVRGRDGLDELTIAAPTAVTELRDGDASSYEIRPEDLGLSPAKPEALVGGEPAENAEILRSILDGAPGPRRDVVLLNAAFALVAAGKARTPRDGVDLAAESIDSGTARAKLEALVRASNEA